MQDFVHQQYHRFSQNPQIFNCLDHRNNSTSGVLPTSSGHLWKNETREILQSDIKGIPEVECGDGKGFRNFSDPAKPQGSFLLSLG